MNTTLILSLVVAISTVIYTLVNVFMLIESYKIRKQKIEPLIVGFLKSNEDHTLLKLHIKNVGQGLAKNVKINVIKDYYTFGKKDSPLSNLGIFKHGLSVFPVGYELNFFINQLTKLDADNNQSFIEFEITYDRLDNYKLKSNYRLYFREVMGMMYKNPPEEYIGKISYHLEKISQKLENKNLKIQEF